MSSDSGSVRWDAGGSRRRRVRHTSAGGITESSVFPQGCGGGEYKRYDSVAVQAAHHQFTRLPPGLGDLHGGRLRLRRTQHTGASSFRSGESHRYGCGVRSR